MKVMFGAGGGAAICAEFRTADAGSVGSTDMLLNMSAVAASAEMILRICCFMVCLLLVNESNLIGKYYTIFPGLCQYRQKESSQLQS
jgi:hypothetical protein